MINHKNFITMSRFLSNILSDSRQILQDGFQDKSRCYCHVWPPIVFWKCLRSHMREMSCLDDSIDEISDTEGER